MRVSQSNYKCYVRKNLKFSQGVLCCCCRWGVLTRVGVMPTADWCRFTPVKGTARRGVCWSRSVVKVGVVDTPPEEEEPDGLQEVRTEAACTLLLPPPPAPGPMPPPLPGSAFTSLQGPMGFTGSPDGVKGWCGVGGKLWELDPCWPVCKRSSNEAVNNWLNL